MSDNEDDKGDEGQDDKDESKVEGPSKEDFTKLMDTVKAIGSGIQGLATRVDDLGKPKGDDEEEDDGGGKSEPPDDLALERLSRKDFLSVIVDTVKKEVGDPIKKDVEDDRLARTKTEIISQINDAKDKHPDFMEFREEMQGLAQAHPTLSPLALYREARVSNPDKASKMDDKYKKEDDDTDRGHKGGYGGMKPSSGSTSTPNQKMTMKEASDAAWEEAMADIPSGLLSN